jgi:hypothetical protein
MANNDEDKVHLVQTLLTVNEVFVYRIPPMKTSGGHRYGVLGFYRSLDTWEAMAGCVGLCPVSFSHSSSSSFVLLH